MRSCRRPVPADLSLGSELWLLYFDRDSNAYEPKLEGTVEAIGYRGYYVGGRWFAKDTVPMFGSEDEAIDYIAEHPFSAPEIK